MARKPPPAPAPLIVAEPRATYAARAPLVIDCSMICAVLFQEPEREQAAARMAGQELHSPALLDYEVVSVALKKLRHGRRAEIANGLTEFAAAPVALHPVDIMEMMALAQRYALSAYDAAYLWLAASLRAPLATFDRKLGEAAQEHLSALGS